jgi:hypothetical protein
MCKKLILLVSVVLVLDMVLISGAGAQPDLIGWWKLDEGSGDIAVDSSSSGNDGTIAYPDSGGLGPGGSVWFTDPVRGTVFSSNGNDSTGCVIDTDLIIPAIGLDTDFTWTFWAYQDPAQATNNDTILGNRNGGTQSPLQFCKFTPTRFEFYNDDGNYEQGINYNSIPGGEWIYHTVVKDGADLTYYRNGEEVMTNTVTKTMDANPFYMGGDAQPAEIWQGRLSDVRLYTKALSVPEVIGAMKGILGPWPYASNPDPADGALYPDVWATMSWSSGAFAISHDVYMGDNFDDVNDATRDSDTFRGNQALETEFYISGFIGYAFPDGLVPGTTYYWRIDEVNDTEPNSPWKGDVWSFSIPPKTAYFPDPVDDAELVDLDARLSWTTGFGAKLHFVVFGEDFDEVSNVATGTPTGTTNFNPGPLKLATTYYWRIDESDGLETFKGDVWSFTTVGAASNPNPANDAVDVKPSVILSWDAGSVAASHEVYFGTDADAVKNATTASPEYKGPIALGEESYDPGKLEFNSTYYWRIDEVNDVNPDSPWPGRVLSFTTGDFFVIDDFEDYDTGDNQIWYAWHDGLGYGAVGTDPYFAGNGTGAAVGDENTPSYTEETIVHGGGKSMPVVYDNNKQGYAYYSEVEHTLKDQQDWTERGVDSLSIWFRGISDNGAEPLYVAVSNSTGTAVVVVHDDPAAAQIDKWTQWIIPLQVFADQGIVLTSVDKIAIGMGTQGNSTAPGGSGKMYFDDIRLIQADTAQ